MSTKDITNNAFEAQKQQELGNGASNQAELFPHKRRNQVMAAGFAVIAMAGYAIGTGLLQVESGSSRGFSRSLVDADEDDDN